MRTLSTLVTLCVATLSACLVDTASYSSEACGNGVVDPGEECDHGTQNSDSGACLVSCRLATCGDGHVYPMYEQCDDSNKNTEACEYGVASCTVCDANCQEVSGTTSVCGDGITDPANEACDDTNPSCGTCNSECQGPAWQPATGHIHAASGAELEAVSSRFFRIYDGSEWTTFELEVVTDPQSMRQSSWGKGGEGGSPNIDIVILVSNTSSAAKVAKEIALHINDQSSLDISAMAIGADVRLTHTMLPWYGFIGIDNYVDAESFWVDTMDGVFDEACEAGQSCVSDDDCEAYCESGVCHEW